MQNLEIPITTVTIELVSNGFIVYENDFRNDFHSNRSLSPCVIKRLVFNNQRQLNKYLNKNLKPVEK